MEFEKENKMKIIKKGISEDVFVGKCGACFCEAQTTRGELSEIRPHDSLFPLFNGDEITAKITINCPVCGKYRMLMECVERKDGNV